MTDFYHAIRYMLLSTALFGLMNAMVKTLIDYPTFELIFFSLCNFLADCLWLSETV
ncbi:MAG: hypothetical protein ACPF9N_02485 [Flavobacteriaceae bacterium]